MKNLPALTVSKIKANCCLFYKNVLKYVEARYEFDDSKIKIFEPFSLKNDSLNYDTMSQIIESLHIHSFFEMDDLYEEICNIKELIQAAIQNKDMKPIDKWHNIFKNQSLPNLLKLFSFIASIPVSNAATERVFSQANITWSDKRNRLTLDHVKAEIQIKTNFKMSCEEFYNYALKNKQLLMAAKSNTKYKKIG